MIQQQELTAQDIRELMQAVCQEYLPLEANGYICTSAMLYDVLMKAASEGISIDAVCRDLECSASGNRIRELLNEQLDVKQLREIEEQINQALAARIPQQVLVHGVEAAIDEHNEPCYSKSAKFEDYVCRGMAKAGTTRFLRIYSLYVIYRQMRLTLAVAFARPDEKVVAILQRLHQRAQALKLQIEMLYLDRGFCSDRSLPILKRKSSQPFWPVPFGARLAGLANCAGAARAIALATPSPMAPVPKWRSWPPSCPIKTSNVAANGCSLSSSVSIGNPKRSIDAIAPVSVSRLRIASCAASASRQHHAIRRFASSCWALRYSW